MIGHVLYCWPTGVGLLVDRHQPHQAHQPAYPFLVHQMAVVAQMPSHLADTKKRRLQVRRTLINPPRQVEVLLGLALSLEIEGRERDRQQPALLTNGKNGIVRLTRVAPHLPVHGLNFRDKVKGDRGPSGAAQAPVPLAAANSPILACSSLSPALRRSRGLSRRRARTRQTKLPAMPASLCGSSSDASRTGSPAQPPSAPLQRFKRHLHLELRQMLLSFPHL